MFKLVVPYHPTLTCLLAALLVVCFAHTSEGNSSYTLDEQYECFSQRLAIELKLNPAYKWGARGLEIGAVGDCSGKLYAMFSSCGFMVQYVPAKEMYEGLAGWDQFPIVKRFGDAKRFTLVFFTFPPKPGKQIRPNGHVGVLSTPVYQEKVARMAHAGSDGFVEVTIDGNSYYFKYMTGFRGGVD